MTIKANTIAAASTRMKDSWLYHQIEQWNIDKTYVISDETRRLLFNLSLGM